MASPTADATVFAYDIRGNASNGPELKHFTSRTPIFHAALYRARQFHRNFMASKHYIPPRHSHLPYTFQAAYAHVISA